MNAADRLPLTLFSVSPQIVDILGWNIGVYHVHANLSPPPVSGDVLRDVRLNAPVPVIDCSSQRSKAGALSTGPVPRSVHRSRPAQPAAGRRGGDAWVPPVSSTVLRCAVAYLLCRWPD